MTAVKGSKQCRMVVVRYRPWRPVFWTLFVLVVMAAGVAASFYWGHYKGVIEQADAVAERDRLRIEVADLSRETEQLRQQVANLRLGTQVDQQASEEMRNQVIALKEEVAALEEDITFYRGLMSPGENNSGLTIGSLNVLATDNPRQFEYKLVIQQLATDHQVLSGQLNFNIVGRQEGALETLSLYQLSEQVEGEDIRLRFRYFQNIEGRLTLPEGFEPERIELVAASSGRNAETVEKKFGWLVQEL
ncbi:DUF6776 family protein [Marinimicrobium sp. ARAG 43.8]|uniref:DUF6776 family protein n=1 Tax=Marinimicrobium sp. ARAG 43.8 TaxID=3418719 RepID=UPI003CFAB3A5